MSDLRWEERPGGFYAYSGELVAALVVQRGDGDRWVYDTCGAVQMKWTAKGYGEVASAAYARRAVDRAWRRWLERAGLMTRPVST